MPKRSETLTTGEVAAILEITPRTVSRLIDDGAIVGYRLHHGKSPGDRRVSRNAVAEYLHKIKAAPALFTRLRETIQGAIVALDPMGDLFKPLAARVSERPVWRAESLYAFGMLVERFRPGAVVMDVSAGRAECIAAAAWLSRELPDCARVAVVAEDAPADVEGFGLTVFRPIHWESVLRAL